MIVLNPLAFPQVPKVKVLNPLTLPEAPMGPHEDPPGAKSEGFEPPGPLHALTRSLLASRKGHPQFKNGKTKKSPKKQDSLTRAYSRLTRIA